MLDEHMRARQQHASDYLLEDEGLTGELTDNQARPLLDWATLQASTLAADPRYSDEEVTSLLKAIRRAIRHVVSTAADEFDTAKLVALAEQKLGEEQGITDEEQRTESGESAAGDEESVF